MYVLDLYSIRISGHLGPTALSAFPSMVSQLKDDFEIHGGEGAFYLFLKAPWGAGTEFVAEAIRNNLLIIPGNVFSPADTHFRTSYAAEDRTLERGCAVLRKLARQGGPATTAS